MLVVSDLTRLSHLMEKSTFPPLLSINSISLLVFNRSNPYQQENPSQSMGSARNTVPHLLMLQEGCLQPCLLPTRCPSLQCPTVSPILHPITVSGA